MRKSVVVAFFVSIAVGFGAPYGYFEYQKRTNKAEDQSYLARKSAAYRAHAEQLQQLTDGDGVRDLLRAAPPTRGTGIEYAPRLKDQDEVRAIWAVQIVQIYRNSPADKAGLRPNDWILAVDGTYLCNLVIPRAEFLERDVEVELTGKADTATRLFRESPETYTIIVQRRPDNVVDEVGTNDQFNEVELSITQGPVAPEVSAYIKANLERWDAYLQGLRGEAATVVGEFEADAVDVDELLRRRERLIKLDAQVMRPWHELDVFLGDKVLARGQLIWG
jgi:hypothetical protein